MAKKAFEIQGADLILGGLKLEAGTIGVVVPGVSQASTYQVDEVEEVNDQTDTIENDPLVIDDVVFNVLSTSGNASIAAYSTYTVRLDDLFIDEIEVDSPGTYTQQEKTTNESNYLWAYGGGNSAAAFSPFVSIDWFQIPFRPKMRAGEIEPIGGGSGTGSSLTSDLNTFSLAGDTLTLDTDGESKFLLTMRDNTELLIDSLSGDVVISANDDVEWRFDTDNNLTLPSGGDILDSNGDSVLGGSGGSGITVSDTTTSNKKITRLELADAFVAGTNSKIVSTALDYPPFAAANFQTGSVGMTNIFDDDGDDEYISCGELPFAITFLGNTYTELFVGSNGYVTFGDGTNNYDFGDDPTMDGANVPAILISEYDNSYQKIFIATGQDNGLTFRIRFEGSAATGVPDDGISNMVWEMTFYQGYPGRVDLIVITDARRTDPDKGMSGVTDGTAWSSLTSDRNIPWELYGQEFTSSQLYFENGIIHQSSGGIIVSNPLGSQLSVQDTTLFSTDDITIEAGGSPAGQSATLRGGPGQPVQTNGLITDIALGDANTAVTLTLAANHNYPDKIYVYDISSTTEINYKQYYVDPNISQNQLRLYYDRDHLIPVLGDGMTPYNFYGMSFNGTNYSTVIDEFEGAIDGTGWEVNSNFSSVQPGWLMYDMETSQLLGTVTDSTSFVNGTSQNCLRFGVNFNLAGTSTEDLFGYSTAVSGNYAIIGAARETDAYGTYSGKAYIYDTTTWSLLHTLDNPHVNVTSIEGQFGSAVAIDGNYAIVGAFYENDVNNERAGVAHIYNVTTGALLHTLTNPDSSGEGLNDAFGSSVAIAGNYAVVCSKLRQTQASEATSITSYVFDVTTGALVHSLVQPSVNGVIAYDYFDSVVAASGNYAIIGMPRVKDTSGLTYSGKAYVYNLTTGALLYTLDNPNDQGLSENDQFGSAVAISGDYILVGARYEDEVDKPSTGRVYIFDVATGTLQNTLANVNANGVSEYDEFGGKSLAISGNYAIIGADRETDTGVTTSGKVYIFDILGAQLLRTFNNPNAFGTSEGDRFGYSVSASGTNVLIGAPYEGDANGTYSGKTYIFDVTTGSQLQQLDDPNAFTRQLLPNTGYTFKEPDVLGTGNIESVKQSGQSRVEGGNPDTDANFSGDVYLTGSRVIIELDNTVANIQPSTTRFEFREDGALQFNDGTRQSTAYTNSIPQVLFTASKGIELSDAGKHYYSLESNNLTLTIVANLNFPIGTVITVVNQGDGTITLQPDSGVSMYLAGDPVSGSRTLSTYGMATIMQVALDKWFVNGVGLA